MRGIIVRGSTMMRLSVTSRTSRSGGRPASRRAAATTSTRSASCSCRAERLTLTWMAEPAARLGRDRPAGLLEHPASERDDQAGLLGERNELAGREHAALGMAPPHERLGADDAAGLQVDDRLVVQEKLRAFDRAVQIGFQLEALDHGGAHAGLEDLAQALSLFLGVVQGDVGVAQELALRLSGDADRDPAARRQKDLLAVEQDRVLQRGRDPGRSTSRAVAASGVSSRSSANSSPPSRAAVSPARMHAVQAPGDLHEHLVAGHVAERVVDVLEVVEIEQQDGARPAVPLAARLGVGDAVREKRAVGQVRQRVVERLVGELLLERLALLDVADRDDEPADRRIRQEVRDDDFREEPLAALAPQPPLHRRGRARTRDGLRDQGQRPGLFVRVQQVGQPRRGELLGTVAEQALDGRRLVADLASPCR